ncbi:Polynucleotide 5'-hydroxyl-kinase grc3 [Gnomoniopsis sp. IMI 355080]|nr:Polynucleotide 5'-hydroxyl-kinase grc3 [Gnomoniopsis sp. IMI 355080]
MSANKRRKVDVGPATPMLSAAALRKRLLEKQASVSAAESSDNGGVASPDTGTRSPSFNGGGSKAKAAATKSALKKESPRTAEEVLLGDSGTVDETALYEATETVDEPPRKKIQLSSISPDSSTIQKKADGTAVLKFADSSERIVLLGSYGVKVKNGDASICGASLYPSDSIQWVHAPHCHALPVLRCSEKSVIEIHSHQASRNLRNLERLSPVFGNLWNEAIPGQQQTWQILGSSTDGPKKAMLHDLKSPAVWNREIANILKSKNHKPPVLLVCGPKSSGKSTFSRIVTNRLLTDRGATKKRIWPGVGILDIDPGQPEFGPPGFISLVKVNEPNLSPPFCHPKIERNCLVRSHTVASITPASNIEHYKSCVLDLFSHYRSSCSNHPLIINTPGWIQGSGLVLLQELVAGIQPTEILYMSEDGPEDTVEGLKSAGQAIPFTTLPSQSSDFTSRTALHLRHMQSMSYFHLDEETVKNTALTWSAAPLTHNAPWLVSYKDEDNGLLGVVWYGYQPDPELLAEAIDGTIVAIVEMEDSKAFNGSKYEDLVQQTPSQIPYIRPSEPLNPQHSRCLGLALIRGVDTEAQILALSTPLSSEQLNGKKIVLVSGKFDPPTWAYTEDHYYCVSKKSDVDVVQRDGSAEIPWTEKLHGSQKKAVGSKVWRVRRDLGRNNSGGD